MTVDGQSAGSAPARPSTWRPGPWLAWGFYDIGQRAFGALILTYIFAPYFASALWPDPARGQAAWGLTIACAGLLIAIMAPLLGAIADASGPKKPWIAFFGAMLVAGSASLWWAQPGHPSALMVAIVGVIIAAVGSEMSVVFHNALLPTLARREQIGRLSGLGWALGTAGAMMALLVVLGALAVDPRSGLTLGGWAPMFALDPVETTAGRLVGPLVAVWFAIFVTPMFLWMPDEKRSEAPLFRSIRNGLTGLRSTLAELRSDRKLSTFLIAYLLYSDGLITLVAFGGVYAAGLLGWGAIQLAALGLTLGLFAGPFVLLTGRLDDRIGPQRVVTLCLLALSAATVGLLGVSKTGLFGMTVPGLSGGHFLLFFAIIIGLCGGPLQSSSRTLLAHLAPRERITQMFGLLALSGRVTSFAGPALVGVITAWTGSQRLGFSVALVFLVAGAAFIIRLARMEDRS
jgi:UMF1 family MFS transporter